jgi:hypothetical protein
MIYTDSVRTSQGTHYVSATNPNRLLLFWEKVAVYCENGTRHIATLWAKCIFFLGFRMSIYTREST